MADQRDSYEVTQLALLLTVNALLVEQRHNLELRQRMQTDLERMRASLLASQSSDGALAAYDSVVETLLGQFADTPPASGSEPAR